MKAGAVGSKEAFREVGVVHATARAGRMWAVLWPVLGIGSFLGVLVLAGYWDARAEQEQAVAEARHKLALQQAYGAGLHQGQAEMLATAEAGWQAAHMAAADDAACVPVRRLP